MTVRGLVGRCLPAAALCAVAAFASGGCSSGAPAATRVSADRPSTRARLQITAPAPDEVTGRQVEVVLHLDDARLVPATQVGGRLRSDRGHVHLSVDGQLVAMPYLLRDRVGGLRPGVHTIEAEFVASDHLPFANRVVAAVTFRVR